MIREISAFIFASGLHAFGCFFGFFSLLYLSFAGAAYGLKALLHHRGTGQSITPKALKSGQIRQEIVLSFGSILIFAGQAILIQYAYRQGWIRIRWEIHWVTLLPEILVLFGWNEVHFYLSHWLLHRKWLFRHVHSLHHRSVPPTPFATYSFHPAEAFLLGTVIFPALLLFPFQYLALLSLPLLSLALNALGHWDYDWAPHQPAHHWLRFSYRHSRHHQRIRGNYGFFLHIFDQIFHTEIRDDPSKSLPDRRGEIPAGRPHRER